MSNPINKAIDEVLWEIPAEILREALIPKKRAFMKNQFPTSVESMIRDRIIDNKVKVDCDLFGGIELTIPLGSIQPQYVDNFSVVYKVPDILTQGRRIMSVLSVSESDVSLFTNPVHNRVSSGSLMSAAEGVLNAATGPYSTVDAHVRIIGPNTVFIESQVTNTSDLYLRCRLSNDAEMSHLPPGAWMTFSKLVVLATKAYIYRSLAIRMDEGKLQGGQNLGRFREFVDGYADSNELYNQALREEWQATAVMADRTAHQRALKYIVGGGAN